MSHVPIPEINITDGPDNDNLEICNKTSQISSSPTFIFEDI